MKHFSLKQVFGRLFLLAAVICSLFINAKAQTAKPVATAPAVTTTTAVAVTPTFSRGGGMNIVESFFKKYKEDGTGPAIDYLFGTNKYFSNSAGLSQLKAKLDSVRQQMGTYLGKELISQKNASNSLVFYSFLVKNEIQPLRFTFVFYRPKNEWVLYRFKYDDAMEPELEEAGRISNKRQ